MHLSKEQAFVFFLSIVLLYFVHFVLNMFDSRHGLKNLIDGGKEYRWPQLSDLSPTIWMASGLIFFRILSSRMLRPLGEKLIDIKYTGKYRRQKLDRFTSVTYKLIYFIAVSIYGFILLSPLNFTPPPLGGNGNTIECWRDYPYQEIIPVLTWYYCLELAYHLHSLLWHIVVPHRKDFFEMLLHHVTTFLLIFFSYLFNYIRIGALVMIVHDLSDISTYAVKIFVDTKYRKLTVFFFICLMISWGYTRLYAYPFYVVWSATFESLGKDGFRIFFIVLLWVLQFLHIYWYSLFIKMVYNLSTHSMIVDIQANNPVKGVDGNCSEKCKKIECDDDENETFWWPIQNALEYLGVWPYKAHMKKV